MAPPAPNTGRAMFSFYKISKPHNVIAEGGRPAVSGSGDNSAGWSEARPCDSSPQKKGKPA